MTFASIPRVSWWRVIVDLERHGYTFSSIAAAIGSARTTVHGWKNLGAEPGHVDGERLVALWVDVVGRPREQLPRHDWDSFSAATCK